MCAWDWSFMGPYHLLTIFQSVIICGIYEEIQESKINRTRKRMGFKVRPSVFFCDYFVVWKRAVSTSKHTRATGYHISHELRTPNEGINQRYLKMCRCGKQNMLRPYIKIWEWDRDIHIECSKQFKWNLYFYGSGQSGPLWAELKLP